MPFGDNLAINRKKMHIPFDLAFSLLTFYAIETLQEYQEIQTRVFIEALFATVRILR